MDREEFYALTRKYFSLTDVEVENFLTRKFINQIDKQRLLYMFDAILPHCDKFVEGTDEKLKRKVGLVFLSRLNYDKFDNNERPLDTYHRLGRLFSQTTSKGINPYKIIYLSVLIDGNLNNDYENRTKRYDSNRDFENIYYELKKVLALTDAETVTLFEKCSTLISKIYTNRISSIYEKICSLSFVEGNVRYLIFRNQEVAEILKINPSLFSVTTEKINGAFNYIQEKVEILINNNRTNLSHNELKVKILRKWLKNNSTLLSMNADAMRTKERYIKNNLNIATYGVFAEQFNLIFQNPVKLSMISQFCLEKIEKFALKNINTLREVASDEKVAKYISDNLLILGMESDNFSNLIKEIKKLDNENSGENYLEKFFEFGKTLFASNIEFSIPFIIDKLINNNIMIDLDIEHLEEREYVTKFIELFCDGNYEIALKIDELIRERDERIENGEKGIRKNIRLVGENVRDVHRILKDDRYTLKEKKDYVLRLNIQFQDLEIDRLRLAGEKDFVSTIYSEENNSQEIENNLNKLRDAYEQKRFKVGKKYSNSDALFENMMEYLGQRFDDKEAISDLFRKEVTLPFVEAVKDSFECRNNPQQLLFGENLIITVPQIMKKPLETISKELIGRDTDYTLPTLSFEKIKE